jgi:acetyl-CoA decarbonylase/synthase complex subunit gamma
VRWGIGRYDYRVEPGLYAIGQPDESSSVLVSANYKLSFDTLRRELGGLDLFVLVLETMGINVWCAAGKGSFGTEELCARVGDVGLDGLVTHRRLILPQLGAPGVAAHLVKERTGFRVKYGPVEARDIPRFIEDGRTSDEMRRKRFPWRERAVLVPMELVPALKYGLPLIAVMAVFAAFFGPSGSFVGGLLSHGVVAAVAMLSAVLGGAVITPLLLPWIPGRAFAVKGAMVGMLAVAPLTMLALWGLTDLSGWRWLDGFGLSMLGVALASFIAMNFTGSSTYTSLSGVEREMRWAVPLQAVGAVIGLLCWGLSIALVR